MTPAKKETKTNANIPALKKVVYEVPIDKHVIHVTIKHVKKYNDRIKSLFALLEEPKDELEYYDAEELKKANPCLYFTDTGGLARVLGNWYYKNNTGGKYTFPLTTDELKSYVLQFIKETEVCLTEQSALKIAQYAPKKKDGTLAKKRVTLLIKSKWANHDGDCTALIARNVSDTDLDIEMIDLYIGEDKFSSAEAIIAAGILDKTSRAQIVSSISAQIGDSAEKKQTITKGHLLHGTKIPRFLDKEMNVPYGKTLIKVVFSGNGINNHFKIEVEPILQEGKTFSNYLYYDRKKYDQLVEKLISDGRIHKGRSISPRLLSENLKQLSHDEILEYFERAIKDIVNCWSEEKLLEIVSSLPRKKDGTLAKNRVTRIIEAPYLKVSPYDGSVSLDVLEVKNISDNKIELRYSSADYPGDQPMR